MASPNTLRYIELKLVDAEGTPVTGRLLSELQVYFTRNNVPCTDQMTLVENGSGRYVLTYTPTNTGHDFIEIYDPILDIVVQDAEDISEGGGAESPSTVVSITQDFGGVGRLKPSVPSPEEWTLYVYISADWEKGRTSPTFAVNSTDLDASGNWLTYPLELVPDTYHIVVLHPDGRGQVIAAFLVL